MKLYIPTTSSPALEKANFPIFSPNQLPNDLKLKEASFRPENPKREYPRCSLKLMLKSESTEKVLYIKEFNYDWAPPAYDCPSLWKNHEAFASEDTPEPQPHLIENDVLWIGVNYRNQRAASITKDRTTIEMVGDFSDLEFIHIAAGLKALDKDQRGRILSKSFAELSYGYSRAVEAVNVPISFWKFPVEDSQIKFQTAFMKPAIPTEAIVGHLPLPSDSSYKLDSVFSYHSGHAPSKDSRYHFIYEHEEHKGHTIQLQHVHKDSPAACAFPPVPDKTQKFNAISKKVSGIDCYYAYRSESYGPHELIFQRGNFRYLMLVKPASWTSREWFFKFLEIFLKCHDGSMQYKKEL